MVSRPGLIHQNEDQPVPGNTLAGTIADTNMVGPPHAVKFSATLKVEEIPGNFTFIDETTGQVCSPFDGTSLDCTMKPALGTFPVETATGDGATRNTGPWPVLRTVVGRAPGEEPCGPPIKMICGRPLMRQAELDVLTTPTGLKLEPAVPLPLSALRVSWPDTQAVGTAGRVVVVVVVLVDVLDVEVVGATVVEVEVEVDEDAGTVVVEGAAALEQPPTRITNPSVITSRLAAAGLKRRNVSPGFDGVGGRGTPESKYGGPKLAVGVKPSVPGAGERLRKSRSSRGEVVPPPVQ